MSDLDPLFESDESTLTTWLDGANVMFEALREHLGEGEYRISFPRLSRRIASRHGEFTSIEPATMKPDGRVVATVEVDHEKLSRVAVEEIRYALRVEHEQTPTTDE